MEDIKSFTKKFKLNVNKSVLKKVDKFWENIVQTVSFFLIEKSFFDVSKFDRVLNGHQIFSSKSYEQIEINDENFIQLHCLGTGASSSVYLIYHIEKEQLFALKIFYNSEKSEELFERERTNFIQIHHPHHPRFYGTFKYENYNC